MSSTLTVTALPFVIGESRLVQNVRNRVKTVEVQGERKINIYLDSGEVIPVKKEDIYWPTFPYSENMYFLITQLVDVKQYKINVIPSKQYKVNVLPKLYGGGGEGSKIEKKGESAKKPSDKKKLLTLIEAITELDEEKVLRKLKTVPSALGLNRPLLATCVDQLVKVHKNKENVEKCLRIIRLVVEANYPINVTYEEEGHMQPILFKVLEISDELFIYLVNQGADLSVTRQNGTTLLESICSLSYNEQIKKRLLKVLFEHQFPFPPCSLVIQNGWYVVVRVMLELKKPCDEKENGKTLLHMAIDHGGKEQREIAKLLINHGSVLDFEDCSLLALAFRHVWLTSRDWKEIVLLMITKGANVHRGVFLYEAFINQENEIYEHLEAAGATINAICPVTHLSGIALYCKEERKWSESALHILKALIEKGADTRLIPEEIFTKLPRVIQRYLKLIKMNEEEKRKIIQKLIKNLFLKMNQLTKLELQVLSKERDLKEMLSLTLENEYSLIHFIHKSDFHGLTFEQLSTKLHTLLADFTYFSCVTGELNGVGIQSQLEEFFKSRSGLFSQSQ